MLQTKLSRDIGNDLKSDESDISHGTKVASKALGRKHGTAKGATLIPVKATLKASDFADALKLITDNIKANPGRAEKSVVVCSLGWGVNKRPLTGLPENIRLYKDPLDALFSLGVPYVASAGNGAQTEGREDIDNFPKVYEDQDTPIINVGGAMLDGSRWKTSQAGPQLTLYAPGHFVEVQSKNNGQTETKSGTSYGKPS